MGRKPPLGRHDKREAGYLKDARSRPLTASPQSRKVQILCTPTRKHQMHIPFRSSPMTVKPEWIDFNGHLNMAYYNVLFDQSVDELYPHIGLGEDYRTTTGCTTYVAEFHICYLRELHEGDTVTATFHLMAHDAKRFHSYMELSHTDGWLAATAEALTLHVDQSGPKVAPMPQTIQDALAQYAASQTTAPDPSRTGRRISLTR